VSTLELAKYPATDGDSFSDSTNTLLAHSCSVYGSRWRPKVYSINMLRLIHIRSHSRFLRLILEGWSLLSVTGIGDAEKAQS
jgi:hypothetical protein